MSTTGVSRLYDCQVEAKISFKRATLCSFAYLNISSSGELRNWDDFFLSIARMTQSRVILIYGHEIERLLWLPTS